MIIKFFIRIFFVITPLTSFSQLDAQLSMFNELGDFISVKNHPKSLGVSMKILVPYDCQVFEGKNPHVVKNMVFKNDATYTITITENVTFFSRSEIKQKLSKNSNLINLSEQLTSYLVDAKVSSLQFTSVDNYPCITLEASGYMEMLSERHHLYIKVWVIFYEDRIITLQGGCENENSFFSSEPIFNIITTSVSFPEQYF